MGQSLWWCADSVTHSVQSVLCRYPQRTAVPLLVALLPLMPVCIVHSDRLCSVRLHLSCYFHTVTASHTESTAVCNWYPVTVHTAVDSSRQPHAQSTCHTLQGAAAAGHVYVSNGVCCQCCVPPGTIIFSTAEVTELEGAYRC